MIDLEKIRTMADRVATSEGLALVDVELKGGGSNALLRVFIDKATGVSHADCQLVSEQLSVLLDMEDPFPGKFVLEVSSPGLDRKLVKAADFERFRGQRVKLMTREPVNDNRHFEGKLESFENDRLLLDLSAARKKKMRPKEGEGSKIEIELKNVEKANLVPEI